MTVVEERCNESGGSRAEAGIQIAELMGNSASQRA